VAADWPLYLDGAVHLRCGDCGQSVQQLVDGQGTPYPLTAQQLLDATVMHVRRRHEDAAP
jgi:hypothetical protein